MPIHRRLSLKLFLHAVSPDLIERYFNQLKIERPPSGWGTMNAGFLQKFLDDPENVTARAIIREDFQRMNDLCGRGMSLVANAYKWKGISIPEDRPTQESAMLLFLDQRQAFNYAWSQYLVLHGSKSKLTTYYVKAPDLRIGVRWK